MISVRRDRPRSFVTGGISSGYPSVVVGVILLQLYPANTALALRITPVRLRISH